MSTIVTEAVLFDFKDPAQVEHWHVLDDRLTGGASESGILVTRQGTGIFSGTLSSKGNGGFALLLSDAIPMALTPHDGIEFRVRGDGRRYKFCLYTTPAHSGHYYAVPFITLDNAWQSVQAPFSDFKSYYRGSRLPLWPHLHVDKVHSLGFMIAEDQEGAFQLEIDWVRAYYMR